MHRRHFTMLISDIQLVAMYILPIHYRTECFINPRRMDAPHHISYIMRRMNNPCLPGTRKKGSNRQCPSPTVVDLVRPKYFKRVLVPTF